ncbi:hypothetical protein BBJ28_00012627 [Nothophytophthora sp. Chile5]|nr:hypothetical protein BBJ28_00012627 [Nothophytophthora sp. Chile5]
MNLQAAIAIAAVALVGSAAASSSSSSDSCSSTQQTAAYVALASVLTLSSFEGCTDDSGYSLLYSTALPTDAEYALMCASDDCQSLISAVAALDPPDCDLTVPTSGLVLNVYELVTGFSDVCASLSSSGSSTTSTTSSADSTTATTTATTSTATSTATSTDSSAAATTTTAPTTTTSSNSTDTTTTSSSSEGSTFIVATSC